VKTFNNERGFSTGLCAGESGKYEQLTEAFSMGRWLKKAGITCVISTSEGNDDMIIPRQENPNHALMRVGNDGNSILHVRVGLRCEFGSKTHAP
jgi:hypothetical protein